MHPRSSFLVGLIGSGIAASRSPPMQEAAADAAGIRYPYKKIDLTELKLGVEALSELLTAARRMGFDGLNITHPSKQAIPSAAGRAFAGCGGAWRREYRRDQGWSADRLQHGLVRLRREQGVPLGRVVQFGAGGAGSAVALALMLGAQELTVIDVNPAKAQSVVNSLPARFGRGV